MKLPFPKIECITFTLTPLWFFKECAFQRNGEALVFCEINIIINQFFPENFIEIP